ncbi:barstar family protein [Paenibacillus agilis]|uniref:barstar family protein n=1 Tax=Paenibacillus agilis TaxID=3020863 RepID=UPI001649B7DF|nr:barstar family protein [Paenibacillus agilis]
MKVSSKTAFQAMINYLEVYYARTKSDDVGNILGDLTSGLDPAVETDWEEAILKAQEAQSPYSNRLFLNSDVVLFYQKQYIDSSIDALLKENYNIHIIDCSEWKTEMDFHNNVAQILGFPSYYGKNLNAFNDCLSDMYPSESDIALVFLNFEILSGIDYEFSRHVLDIIQCQARSARIQGTHLCSLVQTNDKIATYRDLGTVNADWNSAEW